MKRHIPECVGLQNDWYILCVNSGRFLSRIVDDTHRFFVRRLVAHGYIPTHTTVGKARCTKKHWNVEKYRGRNGNGFRMITSYPKSHNFNTITYFIKSA